MKTPWYWILVIFAGSLPVGSALQYYFAGEPYRNTPTRNWLVVVQVLLGVAIMAFGLFMQFRASRQIPDDDHENYKITEDDK